MNHKVLYRVALFCLFSMLSAVLMHAGEQQQQSKGIVTGRIVDQQKQPYYPVAVAIEGVYIGGYTNAKTEMVRLYIEGDMTAKDAK